MKRKEFIIRYFMLLVSFILLFSVVIPHHHHSDGMPCYKSLFVENTTCHSHDDVDSHDCGCNGHNVAFYTSLFIHVDNSDVHSFLFPLLVLFDYINPSEPSLSKLLVDKERAFYIEFLHDTWIKAASGLRAPPFIG